MSRPERAEVLADMAQVAEWLLATPDADMPYWDTSHVVLVKDKASALAWLDFLDDVTVPAYTPPQYTGANYLVSVRGSKGSLTFVLSLHNDITFTADAVLQVPPPPTPPLQDWLHQATATKEADDA